MKRATFVMWITALALIVIGGTASAVLPSGNGQTVKARSVSVAIASDQTVPVSGTITATVDTSALATAAKQDTGNTSLGTIATNTTGVATAANQSTGNTSLSTIGTNTGNAVTALNLLTQPKQTTSVTPSDATDTTTFCGKGIWVGVSGDVAVKMLSDSAAVTLKNVPGGSFVPGQFLRIMSTNTTATNIVCFGGTG